MLAGFSLPFRLGGSLVPGTSTPEWYKTRHRAYLFALTWRGPLLLEADLVRLRVSKQLPSGMSWSAMLYPNPRGSATPTLSYLDLLHPNSWVWAFVDPNDGGEPECLGIGLIDRVWRTMSLDEGGRRQTVVMIAGSGWQKAVERTQGVSDKFLLSLGGPPNLLGLMNTLISAQVMKTPLALIRILQAFLSIEEPAIELALGAAAGLLAQAVGQSLAPTGPQIEEIVSQVLSSEAVVPGGFTPTNRYLGQMELPTTGIPLWKILSGNLHLENTQEYVFKTLLGQLGSTSTSAMGLLQAVSNPALNELIFDTRNVSNTGLASDFVPFGSPPPTSAAAVEKLRMLGTRVGGRFGAHVSRWLPHIIFRRRPLFLSEYQALPRALVAGDDEVIAEEIGRSDTDVANVSVPAFTNPSPAMGMTYRVLHAARYFDAESARRHGLRFYEENISTYPVRASAATEFSTEAAFTEAVGGSVDAFEEIQRRMFHGNRFNDQLLAGYAQFRRLVRGAFIGGTLLWGRKARESLQPDRSELYYITGMDYEWSYPGPFSHTLTLVRGHTLGADQPVPVSLGAAEAQMRSQGG